MTDSSLGPIVAIVGSDGSGKSTVGEALLAWLGEQRPVAMCHLGKQTGDYGRAIRRLPLVGDGMDRALDKRADRARAETGSDAITAIAHYLISTRRVRRFRRMMKIRRKGITIIADRYPQTAVLSPKMDGPHLNAVNPRSRIARLLGQRERRLYDWMVSFRPDLVIRLNVDLETAAKRKPDHKYSSLAAKVAQVPRLSYNGAPIVDIDSRLPLDEVIATAKAAVTKVLGEFDARPA